MEYERIDLISLFDLEFHNDRVSKDDLRKLSGAHGNQDLENLYLESRNWVFGREPIPSLQRFCFLPSARLADAKGNSILVSPEHGAGVFSVWQTITDSMAGALDSHMGGTASAVHLENIDFAGKTGTAQVVNHSAGMKSLGTGAARANACGAGRTGTASRLRRTRHHAQDRR